MVDPALADPEQLPRELAWQITDRMGHFVSESSVYRILKAHDLITSPAYVLIRAADHFEHPTKRPDEPWQPDFAYLRVVGWGWYCLSVLDDYSRYILAWTLGTTMKAPDVTETLDLARAKAGVDSVAVVHRPRLLSDNGPCYLSGELATYLDRHGMEHTRGAPYHPMTQGKIERNHRSMKNVVELDDYYDPWEFERALFVEDYNHRRYHESLQNVTPADVFHGRRRDVLSVGAFPDAIVKYLVDGLGRRIGKRAARQRLKDLRSREKRGKQTGQKDGEGKGKRWRQAM